METLTIPIDAVPQQRPRVVKGRAIDPPKSKKFKEDFALILKSIRRIDSLYTCELKVAIDIFRNYSSPANHRFGDCDNLAKGILDACNGVLWKDDSQIVDLHIKKFSTDCNPRVELSVASY